MKAYLCRALVGLDGLSFEEVPDLSPGPGEVRIRVRACGINFADSLVIAGKYQAKPELPFIPGAEISGEIVELGPGVETLAAGERVIAAPKAGGYSEEAIALAAHVVPMPDGMPYDDGAAFQVTYGTSHVALDHRARLKPGEVLVVHGAAGGVGLTAVEIGRHMGATVIAAASSPEKLALAAAKGAHHLIDVSREDIRERVKALTGGRGADVVYDPVGGEAFAASLRSVAFEGRLIVIGFAGGAIQEIPANHVMVKNVDVIGLNIGAYRDLRPEVVRLSYATLMDWYLEGGIKPHISDRYPLERALDGLQKVIERRSTGKVVITMNGGSRPA